MNLAGCSGRLYVGNHPPTAAVSLTSPVAAIQLAAGAFFPVKLATQDFTSPVAANHLAAGAFFSVKLATPGFDSPEAAGCC